MAESKTKSNEEEVENPDIHFEPIVKLPEVEIKTLEDDEDELVKLRAKLFRYDSAVDPPEWKERGVGDIKILKHKEKGTCRILMRRDKTFKICANHYVSSQIELKPNCGSDRAWVWSTACDFADEEPKPELLAIRFANAENAQKFKTALEEAKKIMESLPSSPEKGDSNSKEATNNDSKTESVQSAGDTPNKESDKKEESADPDKETDTVADKLGALSVGEKKSEESKTEGEGSPEAER